MQQHEPAKVSWLAPKGKPALEFAAIRCVERRRLFSHAEPDYAGCCATFGTGGGPLNGSGTFLANGRNQHFALIARDGISGAFDMTQSACLSGLTLRARRSRRTVGSAFATFASHALRARGTLLAGASLRTGGSGWTLGTRRS